jgi:hypothetical protein
VKTTLSDTLGKDNTVNEDTEVIFGMIGDVTRICDALTEDREEKCTARKRYPPGTNHGYRRKYAVGDVELMETSVGLLATRR